MLWVVRHEVGHGLRSYCLPQLAIDRPRRRRRGAPQRRYVLAHYVSVPSGCTLQVDCQQRKRIDGIEFHSLLYFYE